MTSVGLVKALFKEKFPAIKEMKNPVKIENVGKTPVWMNRSFLLHCLEFSTSRGPLVLVWGPGNVRK